MKFLNQLLDACRQTVRSIMRRIARGLNSLTRGKLSPHLVTITGLTMHVPIAWLIAQGYFGYAALGLVIFGLFDTLDGELARLQNKASNAGMLLDAVTDRMKEVILYGGIAYLFVFGNQQIYTVWAVLAAGGSLLVSYTKAKGEVAVKDSKLTPNEINRLFSDGLLRFELRMFLLAVGLIFGVLSQVVVVIAVLSWATALERLVKIARKL